MMLALLLMLGDDFVYTQKPLGVIVPASKAQKFLARKDVGGYFTPATADIARLEAKLLALLKTRPPGFRKDIDKRVASYARQYVGIIVGGERRIWVNAFCDPDRMPHWKTDGVEVDDGGDCYFQGEYDVKKATFLSVVPNGEA